LATSADAITLSDIYRAVEDGSLFAMHASPPNQACPVGRGIQPVLTQVYDALDAVLQKQLAEVTIKDILDRILAKDR
jgi:DNA-binding IscR family transcriptional regulator